MKVVTGGAGFIGSHLVEELVKRGEEVAVVDNFHTGSKENLKGLWGNIRVFEARAGDLQRLNLKDVDVIFHLGIYSSSPMYKKNPELVARVLEDAIKLFEFAKNRGCKVILASTSSIYNGLPLPWKEDMRLLVTDFYTEARIAVERLAELYHKLFDVECVILRLFSVYGPREESKRNYANIISQFIWKLMRGEAPVIFGDGSQTRDFIFVKDVVQAFLLAMESRIKFDVFNVGTGVAKTFNEIVELINKEMGTNIQPRYVENPIKNYVYHTLADTTKAEQVLGFKAKVELEEGVRRTIEYYKQLETLPEV